MQYWWVWEERRWFYRDLVIFHSCMHACMHPSILLLQSPIIYISNQSWKNETLNVRERDSFLSCSVEKKKALKKTKLNLGSSTSIDKSTKKSTFRNMSQPNSFSSLASSSLLQLPTPNLQTWRSPKWQVDRLKVGNPTRLALGTQNLYPTSTRIFGVLPTYPHDQEKTNFT